MNEITNGELVALIAFQVGTILTGALMLLGIVIMCWKYHEKKWGKPTPEEETTLASWTEETKDTVEEPWTPACT